MDNNEILDIESFINNIFSNAILVAVDRRLDLSKIVPFIDKHMEAYGEVGKEFLGLVFVKNLAKEMKVSVEDLLNSEENYKSELVRSVIAALSMDGTVLDIEKPENDEGEAYITYVLSDLNTFDKTALFIEIENKLDTGVEEEKSDYLIELEKRSGEYTMSILTNNLAESKYFKNQIVVWREEKGFLAEFIEEAFEENLIFAFKEGLSGDEMLACVFDDTRTINLMDRFEGFGENNSKSYQRLVIKNGMLYCNYGDPYIHLVIERRTNNNIKGNITITEFKQGNNYEIRQHILEELDSDILNAYKDRTEFYRFQTGYLLRAQNSKNRSGYGWVWNWQNGVGTYVKGTEYGETTDYVFVGAYISSSYIFDPDKRESMLQSCLPTALNYEDDKHITEEQEASETVEHSFEKVELLKDEEVLGDERTEKLDIPIFDIDDLRKSNDGEVIRIGSYVEYKKLHVDEMGTTVITEDKLMHKKFMGHQLGEIIVDGSRRYLITKIINN